ncbi:sulfite exporter TauE/SafE family protein [Klenkia taihuensis]|uniref:Probable membrane transporter protein n=1 Tax=Klenkia taihuensis TaxID=1225127 RepID=A0A1I1UMA0_9ACTN|nr:sulfite exporter TauE/SafE family protein [Klenkia taihuensis]GHE13983.1 UPF0721 transmembrane protein [Klenkia taihuensis]SFD71879.1 hypothetical protein SAMN05661030_4061 [Klenkia taihuensis]
MRTLVLFALVGLGAQLVDGSLGMAYGVTSTTLLLVVGASPAAASATVHLAEIGTTLASGLSHWKFGNVDWKVVAKIGLPGAVGAFAGATFLSSLDTSVAAPLMSGILLVLGVYILVRFTFRGLNRQNLGKPMRKRFLGPLGLVAGFVDATGGGGWGPVGTPAILASGRMEPRKVIGSIDTSEFLVALAASLGFLFSLGTQGIDPLWVAGLLIGGLVAAPIAAWLVRHVPPRLLGSAVGGIIVFTNTRSLFNAFEVADAVRWPVYAVVVLAWVGAVVWSFKQYRADTAAESVEAAQRLEAERREELVREASRNHEDAVVSGRPQDPRD